MLTAPRIVRSSRNLAALALAAALASSAAQAGGAADRSTSCRAPLPHGPAVPAPIVLWNSCGAFQLTRSGQIRRLPRQWLAQHGAGSTGRRYGAHLQIRRTHSGAFLLKQRGRLVWRSHGLYPNDGGSIGLGPQEFAFASYKHGVYLTDMHSPERLVVPGRGLYPFAFTRSGNLVVTGSGTEPVLVAPNGKILRRFKIRMSDGVTFDDATNTLFFVSPAGRLALANETKVTFARRLTTVTGEISAAQHGVLTFVANRSVTITTRDGRILARTSWPRRLHLDSGVSVSDNGTTAVFRLTNARPGSRSGVAKIYLLRDGERHAQLIYRERLGQSGCAVGANFAWHGKHALYSSSDGTLAVLDPEGGPTRSLTVLAKSLPRRWLSEEATAAWQAQLN